MARKPEQRVRFAETCTHCNTATVFEVLKSDSLFLEGYEEIYQFCKCTTCDSFALYNQENFGDGQLGAPYRLYPVQKRQLTFRVPKLVRDSYNEAVKCENAQAWLACAVMIGRTLEGVAKEFDPQTRSLSATLKKMLDAGTISADIFEWASQLRITRNMAAHAQETDISWEDATEGMDFAQAILEILYDLKPRFEKMRQRHAK
jgi:hypothetical protein